MKVPFSLAIAGVLASGANALTGITAMSNAVVVMDYADSRGEVKMMPPNIESPSGWYGTFLKAKMASDFPTWTITNGSALLGNLVYDKYKAGIQNDPVTGAVVGATGEINLSYNAPYGFNDSNYRLIQFYYSGSTWNDLDHPDDAGAPFYYTDDQDPHERLGNIMQFYDRPTRPYDGFNGTTLNSYFHAGVFFVEKTGPTSLILHDGFSWGFDGLRLASGSDPAGSSALPRPVPEPATILVTLSLLFVSKRKKA